MLHFLNEHLIILDSSLCWWFQRCWVKGLWLENQTKFPDLTRPFSLKNKLLRKKRSAQNERRFIVLINMHFFHTFQSRKPLCSEIVHPISCGLHSWTPGEISCRGMCQGQGVDERGKKTTLVCCRGLLFCSSNWHHQHSINHGDVFFGQHTLAL